MTPERDYYDGRRDALTKMLAHVVTELGELGYGADYDVGGARWIVEREQAVAALRNLCEQFGDNDWPDNLHLADVIEKHQGRYLEPQE